MAAPDRTEASGIRRPVLLPKCGIQAVHSVRRDVEETERVNDNKTSGLIISAWFSGLICGGLIQTVVGLFGRAGSLFDEAVGIGEVGFVEGLLSLGVELVGLSVVDLVWRHEADAVVVVVAIVRLPLTSVSQG